MGLSTSKTYIPIFPLGGFPLPGEKMELFIFEPRYRQLLKESYASDAPFGVTYSSPKSENQASQQYGVLVKVIALGPDNPDGTFFAEIEGLQVIQISSYDINYPGKLYGGGYAEFLTENTTTGNSTLLFWYSLFQENYQILGKNTDYNIYQMASELLLNHKDKAKFLMLKTLENREKFLMEKFKMMQVIRKLEKKLGDNFIMN
ncbi:MAG: LON peptidase substrate-binding domain-containing protein [Luteibaculaceae bacterium]